jgi:hypothetical protein
MSTRTRVFVASVLVASWACGPTPASTSSTTPADVSDAAPDDGAAPPTGPRALDCGAEVRGAAALTGPGSILLVGEMHGTTQVPELVGRIACHAARAPEAKVILGLEMTADNQSTVDAYLAGNGADPDMAALLAAPHFTSEMKDGRSSQAMQQLLATVRGWRSAGAPIEVVCFDAGPGVAKTAAERDAVMAKTLATVHRDRPGSTLVTLSGNVHNRTVPGVPWDAAFVPMGVHLREAFPKLVSLDFRSAGGAFWACMGTPGGEVKCGATQSGGEDRGAESFVELHAARDDKGFDGVLYAGTTTASEPAVPASPKE